MKQGEEGVRRCAAVAAVLAAIAVLAATSPAVRADTHAPDFSLTDIDGNHLNLTVLRGRIVILDFMYKECPTCKLALPVLLDVFAAHENETAGLSVDILPSDTTDILLAWKYGNPPAVPPAWHIARDTDGVQTKYSVNSVVRIFLVDQNGFLIYDSNQALGHEGLFATEVERLESDLEAKIAEAIGGTSEPIDLQQLSIFALAALAAVGSFFSPCSFPMLPGYMAFFLGLQAKDGSGMTRRRAALSGAVSSLGIILVYGIIWAALVAIGAAAAAFVPLLQPIVGVLLILLGAVMFTAVQFNWLVNPFRRLRERLFPRWTPQAATGTTAKLFSYGVGYGAAGFACVAPPFIAAVLSSMTFGGVGTGLAVLGVYALIVIVLMVTITVILSVAGQAAVKKMNKYTNVIKKVSAAVLIVAGVYLIYFWYSAWVAT